MARTTILTEFKTGREITVCNSEEVLNILRFCNPTMIRHYQNQMKHTKIIGFGKNIKLERVNNEH